MTLISNEETSDRKVQDVTKEIALKVKDDCKGGDMAIHFLYALFLSFLKMNQIQTRILILWWMMILTCGMIVIW
jgi:hypothetical protein